MYKTAVIFLILNNILVRSIENDIFCDERFTVISDIEDADCGSDWEHVVRFEEKSSCVGVCQRVALKNSECLEDPCPPGFDCVGEDPSSCELNLDSCFKYYTKYKNSNQNEEYKNAYWKPECLNTGEWAPKQCKGEVANGRCFCYDAVGKRLFGQQFSTKSENMTCACSRDKANMEKDPAKNWFVSLHCDMEGNYEPLQCNIMDEMCWCVNPQNGEVVSQIVPLSLWEYLPCYDTSTNGEFYMRQCESHLFAQKKLDRILKAHGTMQANYPHVMCDADGSYGTYSIKGGVASCTWRDNSVLAPYGATENFETLDCNCAKDSKLLGSQPLQCEASGSYAKAQAFGETSSYFCVDSDGFQNSEDKKENPKDCENIKMI